MRLLIDENISPEVTAQLRKAAFDVKSIAECCKGYADEEVVALAVHEERIIVTYDLDFAELYRNFGASSVILRLRSKKTPIVFKHLVRFLKTIESQRLDMKGKLAVVTEGKARLVG